VAVQPSARLSAARERAQLRGEVLIAAIAVLAAYDIGLALFMAVAPHAFFVNVGPFGTRNDHYIRDTATFSAAIGVGLLLALRRPSWRVPMLAISTVQFGLHSLNHLLDIDNAHPTWNGYFDFFALALTTVLLAWLLRVAVTQAASAPRRS
jgi:hypothetical protein